MVITERNIFGGGAVYIFPSYLLAQWTVIFGVSVAMEVGIMESRSLHWMLRFIFPTKLLYVQHKPDSYLICVYFQDKILHVLFS